MNRILETSLIKIGAYQLSKTCRYLYYYAVTSMMCCDYREIWRPQSQIPPEITKTVSPMLSHRTSFESYLKDIAHRHHELDKVLPANAPAKSSLALRHPAFACEIKMDGERMLVHIERGEVTMHVRCSVTC